jgi:phage protein D
MAARRVPLEKPPTQAEAAKVDRLKVEMKLRIGRNIKAARTAAGLTLRQAEVRCNVSANYLSELERGMPDVSVSVLVQVATGLGTTVAALVSE